MDNLLSSEMQYVAEMMEQLIKSSEERGKYTLVVQHNSLCGASCPFSDQPVRDRSGDLKDQGQLNHQNLFLKNVWGC